MAIYSSVTTSRTGLAVPVYANGHPAHSKYDPIREAERLAAEVAPAGFFVVAGYAGGYFAEALHRRFPASPIVAVEGTADDIAFLRKCNSGGGTWQSSGDINGAIVTSDAVMVVSLEVACSAITQCYIPALHGNMGIIEWDSWTRANSTLVAQFRDAVHSAQSAIAADTATQARFGKIWQSNILRNISAVHTTAQRLPCDKTALVVAAGPTLDATARLIKQQRASLFVIATDTAYCALVRHGIVCDAVVSIDGQSVSHTHFMSSAHCGNTQGAFGDTLFVMDLCADASTVQYLLAAGAHITFVRTGHPLSTYLAPDLPLVDAGSGTVTIAACDWARQQGFARLSVAGADFAYIGGRPYARGTYLDTLYSMNATRISSLETSFCQLMLRTPLLPRDTASGATAFTTPVLDAYRASFETWLTAHGYRSQRHGTLQQHHTDDCCGIAEYTATSPLRLPSGNQRNSTQALPYTVSAWRCAAQQALNDLFPDSGTTAGGNSAALRHIAIPSALAAALPYAAYIRARDPSIDARRALQAALDAAT